MSDAWFAYAIAPDGDTTDGCHPEEANALQSYLQGQMTATQAAEAITRPVAASQDPDGDLDRLCGLLGDALMELPAVDMARVLDLIAAIEDLPAPDFSAVPRENLPAESPLWRGLSGFGHLWSDGAGAGVLFHWVEGTGRVRAGKNEDVYVTQSIRRAQVEAWLVRKGLVGLGIGWGYEIVTDALERSKAALDTEVPMACEWLKILGDRFREGAEEGESSWALERDGDLWKGKAQDKKTMSKERWDFWMQRLKEIADNDAVSSRTREAAKQCLGEVQ
ncbi:FAD binding domain-containing protein [Apiospora sp. TS-2023a]